MTDHSDGCKCVSCKKYRAMRERKRYLKRKAGIPLRVSIVPARDHVRENLLGRMPKWRIAEAAGISFPTLARVINADDSEWVMPEVSAGLLAVTVDLSGLPGESYVGATGTRRRVQALGAKGYSMGYLADRLGWPRATFRFQTDMFQTVSKWRADAISSLYEELWDKESPEDPFTVARSKTRAKTKGWVPPMAWDDDTIDDPDALPDLGEKPADRGIPMDEVEFKRSYGKTDEQIARELGITLYSVKFKTREAA